MRVPAQSQRNALQALRADTDVCEARRWGWRQWGLYALTPLTLFALFWVYFVEWHRWRYGFYHVHQAAEVGLLSRDVDEVWAALDHVTNVRGGRTWCLGVEGGPKVMQAGRSTTDRSVLAGLSELLQRCVTLCAPCRWCSGRTGGGALRSRAS